MRHVQPWGGFFRSFLTATCLLAFAMPGGSQGLEDCSDRDGCTVEIVYDPQAKTLKPSALPLLIPGDRLSVQVVGDFQKPRSLGAWECTWPGDGGILGTGIGGSDGGQQEVRPTGLLGQQIRLSAFLMEGKNSEEIGKFSTLRAGLPGPRVILRRQHLQLSGAVSLQQPRKPKPDAECSMSEQPPTGTWYEVRVRIVRTDL